MMRSLVRIAGICMLVPTLCIAGDVYLTVPLASYHFKERESNKGSYNQMNLGLGLEYAYSNEWRLGAGIYRNSIRTDTGYVVAAYLPLEIKSVNTRLGVSAGLVSGYQNNLSPLLVPTAAYERGRFGVNAVFFPAFGGNDAGLGFALKWKLQ